MSDPATSFTIEVLGFPGDADPEAVAASLAEFFGIPVEDARRLVRKVPVRVKRRASTSVTQQLVRQLRKLGADVLVRNEQTDEERTYRAADAPPARPGAEPEPEPEPLHAVAPPEDTLESEDANAPPETRPRVEVVVPGARGVLTGVPAAIDPDDPVSSPGASAPGGGAPASGPGGPPSGPEEAPVSGPLPAAPRVPAMSAPGRLRTPMSLPLGEARSSSPSLPGAARASSPSSPGDARSSDQVAVPKISLPPPSQPFGSVPPPSRASLAYCGSCKGPIEKGEICQRCGWSTAEKQRHCRQCKKKLALVSNVSRSPVLLAAIAAGAIAMGAAALVLFGALAGLGALLFGVTLGFLGDGLTLRWACKSCTVAVYSERLQKEEEARLGAARRRSIAVAAASGVAAIALVVLPAGAKRTLAAASFGVAWSVEVPSTHGHVDSEVTMLKVPSGTRRARVQWAEKTLFSGRTYFLINMQYSYPAGPADPDKPGLQATIEQVVAVVFNGSLGAPPTPAGESLEASFTGTFHGKPVSGRLRGAQYDHDMLIVAVTAGSASDLQDEPVTAYLTNVAVQRDPR